MNEAGKVYLVGAGPGDPGLLTLKGLKCLQQADYVLYDGLVNPLLLRHTHANSVRTSRQDGPDGKRLGQSEINQQLIDAARQGKIVVRLKGGDPYIFGRGSEEAAALAEAGIPFEVVPGITAATAAGEYAGISLTHREHASSVTFITGHEDPTKSSTSLDYQLLAKQPGTLVFYMGLHRLPRIVQSLIEHGKSPGTPACVITKASTPNQQSVFATLEELPVEVSKAKLEPPSLIIIGDCATTRCEWFETKPLFGLRIGITRPEHQTGDVIEQCIALGAQPVLLPTIRIEPPDDWQLVDDALARLNEFDWLIFTSVNGVDAFLGRLWETGGDMRKLSGIKIATIGPSTVAALEKFGLRSDLTPESYRAEALAETLKPNTVGQHVLWAGANRGRKVLIDELQEVAASIEKVVVYHNIDVESFSDQESGILASGEIDWIGLSSPSIAENIARQLPNDVKSRIGSDLKLCSISPVTTAAAENVGLLIDAEAIDYTWSGILNAIAQVRTPQ